MRRVTRKPPNTFTAASATASKGKLFDPSSRFCARICASN
eukprot:gene374-496_t